MWKLTENIIDGEGSNLFESPFYDKSKDDKLVYKFRVLDDDDEVYFVGLSSSNSSFAPLDDIGGAYGCTAIQYLENGKWTFL